MDVKEFREFGIAAIDFIADYLENIRDRKVLPSVTPGYLRNCLPESVPEKPEHWTTIMDDLNRFIMPGITHWQSPHFHAYYPSQTSYPSIIGDMLVAGIGIVDFSWICSPAASELETIVMDWLAKLLNLPEHFLHNHNANGGGVIHGSVNESITVCLLAARETAIRKLKQLYPDMTKNEIRGKLIVYSSDQSNSTVEKSCLIAGITIKQLEVDEICSLRGDVLETAVKADIQAGNFPIFCIATLGTTGTCSFDMIDELGLVCQKYNIWLHIDAAYAAGAFVCPEFHYLLKGLEYVDSFNFNLHKWLLVNFECTATWLKDANLFTDAFNLDRIYLKHQYQNKSKIPDYRHWQLALSRKFRSLKLWIVLRSYGIEKIQSYIRTHVRLAKLFADNVESDERFELVTKPVLGLLTFRLKAGNQLTKQLLKKITEKREIYMIAATVSNQYVIRFVICGFDTQEKDIDFAWNHIKQQTDELFKDSFTAKPPIKKTKSTSIENLFDSFSTKMFTNIEKTT